MMASLLDRVLNPARAALDAARSTVAGCTDPQAAWNALHSRGLLPRTWLDDPRRRFPWLPDLPRERRAQALRRAPYVPQAACPDDVRACALLAADIEGIERAEASGRAFAGALRAWGAPAADTVLWVPTTWHGHEYQIHDTKPGVWEPDAFVSRVFDQLRWADVLRVIERVAGDPAATSADPALHTHAASVVGVWVFAAERWADAVHTRQRTPRGKTPREEFYADLPDPFTPALEVFAAGYALMPSGEGKLVLGYPMD